MKSTNVGVDLAKTGLSSPWKEPIRGKRPCLIDESLVISRLVRSLHCRIHILIRVALPEIPRRRHCARGAPA